MISAMFGFWWRQFRGCVVIYFFNISEFSHGGSIRTSIEFIVFLAQTSNGWIDLVQIWQALRGPWVIPSSKYISRVYAAVQVQYHTKKHNTVSVIVVVPYKLLRIDTQRRGPLEYLTCNIVNYRPILQFFAKWNYEKFYQYSQVGLPFIFPSRV